MSEHIKRPDTLEETIVHALKSLIYAAVLCAATAHAQGPAWPAKPLTWIVPFTAGGATDVMARDIAEKVSRQLGQQIVIENVGGAGGTIGAARAARSPADGYTFLVGHLGYMGAAPALYPQLPYDPVKDFDAVFRFPDTPMVLVVNTASPYRNAGDLIDAARRHPGKLNLGNAGVGSTSHLVAALFAQKAGAQFTQVPYRGIPPAITDLMGGAVDAVFDQSNTALGNVSGGRLRAIAVTSAASMPQYPGAEPLSRQFPGFEAATWYGLYAPRGSPPAALQGLYQAYARALADPQWRARMAENGIRLLDDGQYAPGAFAAHTRNEVAKWRQVIADAGIRLK